ncbi:MAG TPA: excalibur calcium-binding domain-containing protein [Phenylobacterium sp.]
MFLTVVASGLVGPRIVGSVYAKIVATDASVPAAGAERYFRNCTAAHAAGVYSIPRGAPGYRPALDADNDGLACEPYVGND